MGYTNQVFLTASASVFAAAYGASMARIGSEQGARNDSIDAVKAWANVMNEIALGWTPPAALTHQTPPLNPDSAPSSVQAARPRVTVVEIEKVVADRLGFDLDGLFQDKPEWIAERGIKNGTFVDCNVPYRGDFREAAQDILKLFGEGD